MGGAPPWYKSISLSCTGSPGSNGRMKQAKVLRVYLGDRLLASARAGKQNFCNRIVRAFAGIGYRVEFRLNSPEERERSEDRRGLSLFHVDMPGFDGALTFRKAYVAPFWQIDHTMQRWDWHVARATFDPDRIDPDLALDFVTRTRERVFRGFAPARTDGFVYVPLQGALTTRRSFQTLSPVEMIEAVLRYDPRPVVATLHPNEHYSQAELTSLTRLADRNPRLRLDTGRMDRYLPACNLVVTQNSSVAFQGYFFRKPTVLFARIDFHHIAANVPVLGVEKAFLKAQKMTPDFETYLYWYLQKMAINAGRKDAEEKILAATQRCGWNI